MISAGTHQPPRSERASSAIVQITLAVKRAQRSAACTLIQRIATVTLTSGRLALRPAHDDAEIATPTVSLVDRFAGEAKPRGSATQGGFNAARVACGVRDSPRFLFLRPGCSVRGLGS